MPIRTPQQKQKYNHAKRVKTFTTAVNNVKELLSNDTILKDIDIETLTDDKISSMIKLLKKVAVINKNKAKLNIDVAPVEQPITVAPVKVTVVKVAVVKPPVVVAPIKKKKSAPVKAPKTKRLQKLILPDSIIKSSNSDLKKKYNILMYKYNQSLDDLKNIPEDEHDRISNMKKAMSKALERLEKMKAIA
jgi:hypothetical protein